MSKGKELWHLATYEGDLWGIVSLSVEYECVLQDPTEVDRLLTLAAAKGVSLAQ